MPLVGSGGERRGRKITPIWKRLCATVTLLALGFAVARASPNSAQPGYSQLLVRIDATTTISLILVTHSGACPLINSNSNWAALDLGSATKNSGTSCAQWSSGNTYTLTTSVDLIASCSGVCTTWNLAAKLNAPSQAGTTWTFGSRNLTTSNQTLASTLAYGSAQNQSLRFSVNTKSAPTGTLQQEITLTASANGGSGAITTALLTAQEINRPGISINFAQDSNGAAVTGGTYDAAVNFGTIAATGSLAPGVTRSSSSGSSFGVQTLVDINVELSGVVSSSYTMQARLGTAASVGLSYSVNGFALTTSQRSVVTGGTYNQNLAYVIGITVSTAASGSGGPVVGSPLVDTINFTAVSN